MGTDEGDREVMVAEREHFPASSASKPLRAAFAIIAAMFGFTACFHLAAAVRPSLDPDAPAWRHLLFVGINAACTVGLVKRPSWFFAPFAILSVQQLWSHGGDALHLWSVERAIDWPSLAVLAVMPATFALLVIDARARRIRSPRT